MNDDRVEITRRVPHPPAVVWPYLTDGQLWCRWQGVEATVEPFAGGKFRVLMPDGAEASGMVLEVVTNRRLRLTWGFTGAPFELEPGSTTVEITLDPDGDGTVIRLVHSGLPGPLREPHDAGWTRYLGRLALLAGGGDPGPDEG